MHKLKINLKELRSAPGQKLHIPFHDFIEGQTLSEPASGEIFLVANSTSVRLTGSIQASVKLVCHHCLNPFVQVIELDLDEEFVYEDYLNVQTSKGKDRELQKEDFFETVPYEGSIDISDIVYQAMVLAIPSYCVCGLSCPGTPFYKDTSTLKSQKTARRGEIYPPDRALDIDPRWNNLKTIFSNDAQTKKVSDNNH